MTYRTTVGLFLVGSLVASCDLMGPDDPLLQLELDGGAEMVGDTIHYTLVVSNPTDQEIVLHGGGCLGEAALRLYELPADGGRLLWDWTVIPPTRVCAAVLYVFAIPPGSERSFGGRKRSGELLGESLPEGVYRLAVIPHFAERSLSEREVPVGDWMLTR